MCDVKRFSENENGTIPVRLLTDGQRMCLRDGTDGFISSISLSLLSLFRLLPLSSNIFNLLLFLPPNPRSLLAHRIHVVISKHNYDKILIVIDKKTADNT